MSGQQDVRIQPLGGAWAKAFDQFGTLSARCDDSCSRRDELGAGDLPVGLVNKDLEAPALGANATRNRAVRNGMLLLMSSWAG